MRTREAKSSPEILEPYQPDTDGPWTRAEAAHLVRRATFGAPVALVDEVLELGPERAVARLLPTTIAEDEDLALLADVARRTGTLEAIQGWWCYRMLRGSSPGHDKLALFWHGHFATSNRKIQKPRLMMRQVELFQRHGPGSFEKLLQEVARDPAMLLWLDSNSNRKGAPNENFARELMELFALGIGNYEERDIQEAARAFTGWHVRRDRFHLDRHAHDDGTKRVFGQEGAFGGRDIVRLCAEHPASSRFIATRLCEYYVVPDVDASLGTHLGDLLRDCKGDVGTFLRRLWSSRLFYTADVRRALIAAPADHVFGSLRTLGARANTQELARSLASMGQDLLQPPSVNGWDTGLRWLNATTLLARMRFVVQLVMGGPIAAVMPWDTLEKLSPEAIIGRFYPDGLTAESQQELLVAASDDMRLLVTGCLQIPEAQTI